MHNLVRTRQAAAEVRELHLEIGPDGSVGQDSKLVKLSLDHDNNILYAISNELVILALKPETAEVLWQADIRAKAESSGGSILPLDTTVAAFAHVPDLQALWLALSTGEMLLLKEQYNTPGGSWELEEVGVVGGGIAAAAWSPDGEVLAIIGGDHQLIIMNVDWELVAEVSMDNTTPIHSQPQPAVSTTSPSFLYGEYSVPNSENNRHWHPGNTSLSWRGDGQFLATCSIFDDCKPQIKIWEKEGAELHALGELAPGLCATLSWQPNCRHLYAAQSLQTLLSNSDSLDLQNKELAKDQEASPKFSQEEAGAQGQAPQVRHVGAWKRELRRQQAAAAASGAGNCPNRVVLYERNGLQHGGFDVPGDGLELEQLLWSPDSEILAIVLLKNEESTTTTSRVLQLWHRSNWHWYLKYERRYDSCSRVNIQWEETGLRLHAMTAEGHYTFYQLDGSHVCSCSSGSVAVLDGCNVLITALRLTVVPPPMCTAAIVCPAPVVCTALRDYPDEVPEAVVAVMSDCRVALCSSIEDDLWEETLDAQLQSNPWEGPGQPKLMPTIFDTRSILQGSVSMNCDIPEPRFAAWTSPSSFIVVSTGSQGDSLVEISVKEGEEAKEIGRCSAPAQVISCVSYSSGAHGALVQLHDGSLWNYELGSSKLTSVDGSANSDFPSTCPKMVATPSMAKKALPAMSNGNGHSDEWSMVHSSSFDAHHGASLGSIKNQQTRAFGLTLDGRLYWGNQLVASQVTSFSLRHEGPGGPFVAYTTKGHVLCTVALSTIRSLIAKNRDISRTHRSTIDGTDQGLVGIPNICQRVTEEGAVVISIPADDVNAILQAPRGNLEVVRPRALVIPAVTEALDAGEYSRAWDLATTNRLDLNILVDYCWPRFLQVATDFISQVGSDQEIADLLAAVTEDSTIAVGGIYAAALVKENNYASDDTGAVGLDANYNGKGNEYDVALDLNLLSLSGGGMNGGGIGAAPIHTSNQQSKKSGVPEKVQKVCLSIREAIQKLESDVERRKWLRSELTTYSKCDDLPAAMRLVKEAKEVDLLQQHSASSNGAANGSFLSSTTNKASGENKSRLPTAEDGLKHLLLHVPEEEVYRAALGSYELELAYMVVTHSQRDPGEYLIDLQRFAAISDSSLRRHAVDLHLQRFDSALKNLYSAGEDHFPQALQLAKEKGLLRLLLQLTQGSNHLKKQVLCALGDDLESRAKHEDAALTFVVAGEHERALRSYRLAGQWRPALTLAAQLGRDEEKIKAMAARIAVDLEDGHRHSDAAAVTLEYLHDVDEGVRLLAAAGEWREALRVACCQGKQDLLQKTIAPAAHLAYSNLLEQAEEDLKRVEKYLTRLVELRSKRHAFQAAVTLADDASDLPTRVEMDAESEAASIVSGLSIYTQNTHLGGTTTAASMIASTIGGRGAARRSKRESKKSKKKVRQGGPEEEAAIARHLLGLAPAASVCGGVGQLVETLCLLGDEEKASALQKAYSQLIAAQQEAVADIMANPPPALNLSLNQLGVNLYFVPVLRALAGQSYSLFKSIEGAVEGSLNQLPGTELLQKAGETEAALKGVHWKWDVFRDA